LCGGIDPAEGTAGRITAEATHRVETAAHAAGWIEPASRIATEPESAAGVSRHAAASAAGLAAAHPAAAARHVAHESPDIAGP
jgi:hypothetical protein